MPTSGSEAGKQMGERWEAAQGVYRHPRGSILGKDRYSLHWINWMLGFQEFTLSGYHLAEMQSGVHVR